MRDGFHGSGAGQPPAHGELGARRDYELEFTDRGGLRASENFGHIDRRSPRDRNARRCVGRVSDRSR
jgi:hypothetical protein